MNEYNVRMIYISPEGSYLISKFHKKILHNEVQSLLHELKKAQLAIEDNSDVYDFYNKNTHINELIVGHYLLTNETDESTYNIPIALELLDKNNTLIVHVLTFGKYSSY